MTGNGGSFSSPFSEADLHAFVDGRLDPVRQIEMTRRLRSHTADRARLDAWREQNELIRATFSEVENESVPVSLSLLPARLRCVAGETQPAGKAPQPTQMLSFKSSKRRRSRLLGLTTFTICGALAVVVIILAQPQTGAIRPVVTIDPDTLLGRRVSEAMTRVPVIEASVTPVLPVIAIPNLTTSGFDLIDVASAGPALLLIYQDKSGQRLALGIAKTTPGGNKAAPLHPGQSQTIIWHKDGNSFALTGTPGQPRLNEIAAQMETH